MVTRTLIASLVAVFAMGLLSSGAEADHRKKRRVIVYDRYYGGPEVVRGIPGIRLFFGDYALSREEFDALYGDDEELDESYYEPEPMVPAKPAKKKPATKKASTTTKSKPAANDLTTASISKTQKTSSLTCDKAGAIVADYGFQSVKPQSCKGKTYAFNAVRDGKNFAIKLDSASGELTEVKKLQ